MAHIKLRRCASLLTILALVAAFCVVVAMRLRERRSSDMGSGQFRTGEAARWIGAASDGEATTSRSAPHESNVVKDPYRLAWEDEGSLEGLVRFFVDVNQDGQPELFVGAKALLGPGGGPFRVYENITSGWRRAGTLFIHPGLLEMLPSEHAGFSDLRYCGAISAEMCSLTVYAYNGREYMPVSPAQAVKRTDVAGRVHVPTSPEDSGLELTWR